MSGNWQVGDLALCVDTALRPTTLRPTTAPGGLLQLRVGRVYRVIGSRLNPYGQTNLFLEGILHLRGLGTCADRFRKILPDEHEACEPEFVTLLKRSKQRAQA